MFHHILINLVFHFFDLLKVRTAIAVCLYQTVNKEKPFLIIEGDFSGIQNFIFNIQSSDEARKACLNVFVADLSG